MATNLAIDDRLSGQARTVGGHKTKKEAVTAARREYLTRHQQRQMLDLVDSIVYDPR